MTLPGTDPDVPTAEETALNEGDWGRDFAHYTARAGVVEAMIYGTPVTALCGWRFVPRRDPLRFPVCPPCREIRDQLPSDDGEAGDL